MIWISQSTRGPPSSLKFVASALNFRLASEMVRALLIKIGVFALDGVIFNIHGDEATALNKASLVTSFSSTTAATPSNFESVTMGSTSSTPGETTVVSPMSALHSPLKKLQAVPSF